MWPSYNSSEIRGTRENEKQANKQTPKTDKTPNQTNQPTHPILFHPPWTFGHLWTHFDFQKSFLIYFVVLSNELVSCTCHYKNWIHKDLASFTSGQKSSIITLKYPIKIDTHFKEYFAFSLTEFPKPRQFFLLCLLYTGNILLSHGTVTYIIRSAHILRYISNLNSFWIYTGKTVKGCWAKLSALCCIPTHTNYFKL